MPFSSIIALSSIVAAFLLFAVVLAWADHQTRHLPRDDKVAPRQPDPRRIRPAAERKASALTNS